MIILREQKKSKKGVELKSLLGKGAPCDQGEEDAVIGFAVDLGTTVIAITAVELKSGTVIGELSETNEQTKLGADVMMRLMHSLSGKKDELHRMAVTQVEQMAEHLLTDISYEKDCDKSRCIFSIVGNTAMCHLFLNQEIEGLAGFPFRPGYTGNYFCTGNDIGMDSFGEARICVLSGIAAHVGSDALAVIGAEKLYRKDKVQLAVDLGTNAEIILNRQGELYVCSTAAGPAFEGKGIQCGTRAEEGAVNGIKMSASNGNIILEYIGGKAPRGICGSGLVDAVAGLRKCGVLQADGYLLSAVEAEKLKVHPEIRKQLVRKNEQNAFIYYQAEKNGREIYLQQSDIRGVQLAKGAIRAGMECLLLEGGLKLSDIDEVIIAGALGTCMRPSNAVGIGLLPDAVPLRFVGNAAGRGAVYMLTDKNFLSDMEQLAEKIHHVELAQKPGFQGHLMQAMSFR